LNAVEGVAGVAGRTRGRSARGLPARQLAQIREPGGGDPFYRDFAREAGSYVAATVCRNQDAAFQHELRLRWGWNFIRASHPNHARGRTWREIGSVSAELISRRCRSLLARARPAQRNG
jgi:hypothetical protein